MIGLGAQLHTWEHQTTQRCPECGGAVRLYLRPDGREVIAFRDETGQLGCRHAALLATFTVVGPLADRHYRVPTPAAVSSG